VQQRENLAANSSPVGSALV